MPVRTGAFDAFLARNKQLFEDIGASTMDLQFSPLVASTGGSTIFKEEMIDMARRGDFPSSITVAPSPRVSMLDGVPGSMLQVEAMARKARLATAIPLAVILALHALVFWPW